MCRDVNGFRGGAITDEHRRHICQGTDCEGCSWEDSFVRNRLPTASDVPKAPYTMLPCTLPS